MRGPAGLVDEFSRLTAVVRGSASDCTRIMPVTALWLAVTWLALGLQAVSGQIPVSFDHGERLNNIHLLVCTPASKHNAVMCGRIVRTDCCAFRACITQLKLHSYWCC